MSGAREEVVVTTFRLDDASSVLGCPGVCPGDQPKLLKPHFVSQHLQQLEVDESLDTLIQDAADIYSSTGAPIIPMLFCHFCVPFSPICVLAYCANKRKNDLQSLIAAWNEEHGLIRGLYLEWNADYVALLNSSNQYRNRNVRILPGLNPGLELRMNLVRHRHYCESKGRAPLLDFLHAQGVREVQPSPAAPVTSYPSPVAPSAPPIVVEDFPPPPSYEAAVGKQ